MVRGLCAMLGVVLFGCGRSSVELPSLDGDAELGGSSSTFEGGTSAGGQAGRAAAGGSGANVGSGGASGGTTGSPDTGGTIGSPDGGGSGGVRSPFFIPCEAVDVAHDAGRELLYVSTPTGDVLRYHLGRRAFDTPISVGGSLLGLALSPNEDTLVVADESYREAEGRAGLAQNWIHVVDLVSGAQRTIEFSDEYYEGGTYQPAFIDETRLLVSSQYPGSGNAPLRLVDLRDDSYRVLRSVGQDTALVPSADGSIVAFAESNSSGGPFGFYNIGTDHFTAGGTDWFNSTIGVSRDGSQLALPTYGGTFVYNHSLQPISTLGVYAGSQPDGVVYSPVDDVMYLTWQDPGFSAPFLVAYDTRTLTRIGVLDAESKYSFSRFAPGKLRISRDGTLLFVLEYEGVHVFGVR